MGAEGVPERLACLPGVLTCAVSDEALTLETQEGTDLRLLRARAEAVCAAGDDARSVVVALGDPPPRGDARKIEDDGSAAQQIVEFLAEKKLL